MYLFQNYMDHDVEAEAEAGREVMQGELLAAGFPSQEIQQAFDWLDSLTERQSTPLTVHPGSYRIYAGLELERLDVECQGLLRLLEQANILDPETRERVIDRAMALESDELSLPQLKWIVLMVLFNQPGREEACAWMEELLFNSPARFH